MTSHSQFFRMALAFEGGLGVAALAVGYLVGFSPVVAPALEFQHWEDHAIAIGMGLIASLPLMALVPVLDRAPLPGLERLRNVVHEQLVPLVKDLSVLQMAIIALVAGWGEELLFRGLLQAGAARAIGGANGWWAALIGASILFALCHAITPSYAILAGGMGLYLGWLLNLTENLLAPIVTHALYDFVALLYLTYEPANPQIAAQEETTSSDP